MPKLSVELVQAIMRDPRPYKEIAEVYGVFFNHVHKIKKRLIWKDATRDIMAATVRVRDNFDEAYIPEPNSGCWLWLRTCDKDGYGHGFRVHGKKVKAHSFSYERTFGAIPAGKWVLHKCDNPSCVNPDHLFLGTHADNMADMTKKGRSVASNLEWREKVRLRSLNPLWKARNAEHLARVRIARFGQP